MAVSKLAATARSYTFVLYTGRRRVSTHGTVTFCGPGGVKGVTRNFQEKEPAAGWLQLEAGGLKSDPVPFDAKPNCAR
jgi:hypothetical protein